jgi:hypothetical protein
MTDFVLLVLHAYLQRNFCQVITVVQNKMKVVEQAKGKLWSKTSSGTIS